MEPHATRGRRPIRPIDFAPALVIGLVVVAVLIVAIPASPISPAGTSRWLGPGIWSNGILVATVSSDHPAVTVAAASGDAAYGLYAGVGAVSELTPGGVAVATANLDSANWTVLNASTSGGLQFSFRALVLAVPVPGGVPSSGPRVFVNFSSGVDAASSGARSEVVTFDVAVLGWPWFHPNDELAVSMPLWPQDTSRAYLVGDPGAANTIRCRSSEGATLLESFSWSDNASATAGSGSAQPLHAVTRLSGDATLTTVQVVFTGTPGGYRALEYDPQITLSVPAAATSLPLVDYAVLGAVAGGAGVLGVLGLRDVWGRPPSLEEVE